jgi:hypothetical protein
MRGQTGIFELTMPQRSNNLLKIILFLTEFFGQHGRQ